MKWHQPLILLFLCALASPLYALEDNFDFGTFSTDDDLTIATRAKWRIFSQKDHEIREGIELLQPLLQNNHFRQLPLDIQTKMILLLLEGYERVGKLQEAKALLQQAIKRTDLWKNHTILKASLAKLYYLLEEFKEGDALLKPLCIATSPTYTAFEQKKISKAILVREDKLLHHLEKAKEFLSKELFIEASLHLEKIAQALLEELAPFQASSLTKKRLALSSLMALSECYVEWDKEKSKSILIHIEKEYAFLLSPQQKLKVEALKKIVHNTFPKEEIDQLIQQVPSLEQKIILWQVQYALSSFSQNIALPLAQNSTKLSLKTYLHGIQELLEGHPHTAYDLLKKTALESAHETNSFKKQCFEAFQEALWTRALFCFCTEKNDTLEQLLEEGEQLEETQGRKSCFYALRSMYESRPIDIMKIVPNHLVALHLTSILHGEKIPPSSIASLSFVDQLFLNIVALYIKQSHAFEIQNLRHNSDMGITLQAISGTLQEESIKTLLANMALDDAHPKLLHILITQAIQRQASKEELVPLVERFIELSSGYGKKGEALVEFFLFMDTHQYFSFEEKKKMLEEICKDPHKTAPLLAILYLQKTNSLTSYTFSKEQNPFVHIMSLLTSASLVQKEADKTKEMSQRTDIIRESLQKFKEAEQATQNFLLQSKQAQEKVLVYGVYIQILSKWTELLFMETLSDHPFLELEEQLEKASHTLGCATELVPNDLFAKDFNLMPRTLFKIQELKSAIDLLHCTFKGEYEEALIRYKALAPDSLLLSKPTIQSVLYLVQSLRKRDTIDKGWPILTQLNEKEIKDIDPEIALEIAIEKSFYLRNKKLYSQAMSELAWVINDSTASSLRIKAMVLRAELYQQLKRPELAMRQLEAAKGKGGQWGQIAEQKLKELYGTGDDSFSLYDAR